MHKPIPCAGHEARGAGLIGAYTHTQLHFIPRPGRSGPVRLDEPDRLSYSAPGYYPLPESAERRGAPPALPLLHLPTASTCQSQ
jgi:hypothetical protein